MINENQELKYQSNIFGIAVGMLIGALAGAVTMLLLAPQSGKETRNQIQQKRIELRNRTTELVESVDMTTTALMMTFIGGTKNFFGPVLGAGFYIYFQNFLSNLTDRWPLFMGILFVLMVLFAPQGLSGLIRSLVELFRKTGKVKPKGDQPFGE